MIIAVVGGEHAAPGAIDAAEAVGRGIARWGATLICGGGGGVMEAACRGARGEGGHTIGVLTEANKSRANPHVEFPIVTGMGRARNVIIVLTADAVIAVDGSYGTLTEIAYALKYGKPVIGLETWSFAAGGIEDTAVVRAESPDEAVGLAITAAAQVS